MHHLSSGRPPAALAAAGAIALALGGCAAFTPDGGFGEVATLTAQRVGQAPGYQRTEADAQAAAASAAELLRAPLTAEAAVQAAFLGNRELQARFAELGIAEAQRVRAGRLANPSLSVGRLGGGGAIEIDRSVTFDLLGLLAMPVTGGIEQRRFEQAQLQAADAAVALATEVRRAWVGAVAARQSLAYVEQVRDAAGAADALARSMARAGNLSALDQMREQAFLADAEARLARARQQALAGRERLARLLGAADAQALRLPDRLPELPAAPTPPQGAQQAAIDRRLDVLMARRATEATAKSLGLTQATRFVDVLDAGWQDKRQAGQATERGYQVELVLPLFDFGTTRVARAQALYMQSLHRAAATAVEAASEVREAYAAYASAHGLAALYRDEVVPLRTRISGENLLRYNGMLIDVFELLADTREQVAATSAGADALRDFWLADADLQAAMAGAAPASRTLNRDTP